MSPSPSPESRTIAIYCNEQSCVDHIDEVVACLQSFFDGGYEIWRVGAGGEHQRLIHRGDVAEDAETLERLGMVAHRHLLTCSYCGYNVTMANRLGMGTRAMAHQRLGRRGSADDVPIPPLVRVVDEDTAPEQSVYVSAGSQKLMGALSQVADRGVSRLPLATLGRIVGMS